MGGRLDGPVVNPAGQNNQKTSHRSHQRSLAGLLALGAHRQQAVSQARLRNELQLRPL